MCDWHLFYFTSAVVCNGTGVSVSGLAHIGRAPLYRERLFIFLRNKLLGSGLAARPLSRLCAITGSSHATTIAGGHGSLQLVSDSLILGHFRSARSYRSQSRSDLLFRRSRPAPPRITPISASTPRLPTPSRRRPPQIDG